MQFLAEFILMLLSTAEVGHILIGILAASLAIDNAPGAMKAVIVMLMCL